MELKKELTKGVELEVKAGEIHLTAKIGALLLPKIEEIEKKVNSGEIDLIKGTDLDKDVLLKAIEFLKNQLV